MLVVTLDKFIIQSKSEDIRTRDYINNYKNFAEKISFGKGRVSNIPWIAFLKGDNEIRR